MPISFRQRPLSLILFALMLFPVVAAAQGTAVLSGRVLEMGNEAPVGFATVVIENAGSGQPVSGALAGENGRFVVQGLAPGRYTVRITFPGFYEGGG